MVVCFYALTWLFGEVEYGAAPTVISLTVIPIKWVIVSDGSTYETDKIGLSYTSGNIWIEWAAAGFKDTELGV